MRVRVRDRVRDRVRLRLRVRVSESVGIRFGVRVRVRLRIRVRVRVTVGVRRGRHLAGGAAAHQRGEQGLRPAAEVGHHDLVLAVQQQRRLAALARARAVQHAHALG